MNKVESMERLQGCYVTIPTMFKDGDLALNLPAVRQHIRFLISGGLKTGNAVVLSGGAAGDFSTMTFDERVELADTVVQESGGAFANSYGCTNNRYSGTC